jgi:hypothetical protein
MKTWRGVEVKLHHSWPQNLMEVNSELHAPAALYPGKLSPVTIGLEAGWAPDSVWTLWRREKSCRTGPSSRRYIDWAIAVHISYLDSTVQLHAVEL